jgi:hypothetical protein
MPHGIAPRWGFQLQRFQRKLFCRREVAGAMLVMDGKRLARLPGNRPRAAGHIEHVAPVCGGQVVLPRPPRAERQRSKSLDPE